MRSIFDILHKNFQDQLNSRFPGFPGGFLNSSTFLGFPGDVHTLIKNSDPNTFYYQTTEYYCYQSEAAQGQPYTFYQL